MMGTLEHLSESAPVTLILFWLIALMLSVVTLAWGSVYPRLSRIISVFLLVFFWCLIGLEIYSHKIETGFSYVWLRGWIWSREGVGAIPLGIIRDGVALVWGVLATLVSSFLVLNQFIYESEPRKERVTSGILFSCVGIWMSWYGVSVWQILFGVLLTILGGFVALGARWNEEDEARFSVRYLYERSWSLVLIAVGSFILANKGVALLAIREITEKNSTVETSVLGSTLVLLGVAIGLSPLPLIGRLVTKTKNNILTQVVLTMVLPFWSVFALLFRFHSQLEKDGLLPVLGIVSLVFSLFSSLTAALQPDWTRSLVMWLSSYFCLVLSAYSYVGVIPAVMLAIVGGVIAIAIVVLSSSLFETQKKKNTKKVVNSYWAKTLVVLSALIGTGFFGFAGAGAIIAWFGGMLNKGSSSALLLSLIFLAAFLCSSLLWKVSIQIIQESTLKVTRWLPVLMINLLLLSMNSVFIQGSLSSGVVSQSEDYFFNGGLVHILSNHLDSAKTTNDANIENIWFSMGMSLLVVLFGWLLSIWLIRLSKKEYLNKEKFSYKLVYFVSNGYGLEFLYLKVFHVIYWVGLNAVQKLDRIIWIEWAPVTLQKTNQTIARLYSYADNQVIRSINYSFKNGSEGIAKGLRYLQSGNIQNYIIISVVVAILFMAGLILQITGSLWR